MSGIRIRAAGQDVSHGVLCVFWYFPISTPIFFKETVGFRNENKSILARKGNEHESPPLSIGKYGVRNSVIWEMTVMIPLGTFGGHTLLPHPAAVMPVNDVDFMQIHHFSSLVPSFYPLHKFSCCLSALHWI